LGGMSLGNENAYFSSTISYAHRFALTTKVPFGSIEVKLLFTELVIKVGAFS